MSYPTSSQVRGNNPGRGRGRVLGRVLGRDRGGLQYYVDPPPVRECSQSTCWGLGFCEFKVMKQEYSGLLETRNRSQWIEINRRKGTATHKKTLDDPRAFLKEFFGKYEQYQRHRRFRYNYLEPVVYEFYRMCREFGWRKPLKAGEPPNPEFVIAREGFRDALALQFNALYGTDEDDLTSWQNLCCVLNLADVPDELETCRNVGNRYLHQSLVASVHVNIIDLIDTPATQEPIVHFKSEEHLSIYTRHTGKKFPRDNVNSGDLLRFLLRKIDAYAWRPLAIDWEDNTNWIDI
ncbi:hypothetical protein FRC11_006711 [Ceratobasidium sp. 423]|nr:hypothetical protein FRC11_006711 [Ceratobasidium sp. 423]